MNEDGDGRDGAPVSPATIRTRRHRAKKKAEAETEAPDLSVDDGDIQTAAQLGRVLWDLAAPFVKMRPLDDEQAMRLGGAMAPLVKKYLPVLGDWQYEVAFALVVLSLARECKLSSAEVLPDEPATDVGPNGGDGTGAQPFGRD